MDITLTLCYILIRYLIPITLGSVVVLRQNVFSSFYLILLFVGPALQTPTAQNVLSGCNGYYMIAIIGISALINSAHIIFQIVLVIATDYNTSIDYCSTIGEIYNMIGLHRYNELSIFNILRLCFLDFVVMLIACMVYAFCVHSYSVKLARDSSRENVNRPARRPTEAGFSVDSIQVARQIYERHHQMSKKRAMRVKADRLTYYLVEGIFCILLCASAILVPSLISAIYFLYFLFIGSWFAFNRHFGSGYHYFRIFIASFAIVHTVALFLYQFAIIRPLLPPDNINARLFGFVRYVNTTCDNVREFDFESYHFVRFLHPFAIIALYFVSVNLIRTILVTKRYLTLPMQRIAPKYGSIFTEQQQQQREGVGSRDFPVTESVHANRIFDFNASCASTIHTPLLSDDKMHRSYSTPRSSQGPPPASPTATTTPGAVVTRTPQQLDEAGLKLESYSNAHSSAISVDTPSAPNTPNLATMQSINLPVEGGGSQFALFFAQMVDVLKRGSYVISLIVMMTWSITYHSWLSFVLLLASCIIWMMPNSRQVCLRSSPIVVAYAILLLIGQYVYSLDLDDTELPITVGDITVTEIGFRKYGQLSYQPLFIKIFYTFFFWVTLRQYSEMFGRADDLAATSPPLGDLASGVMSASPLFNIASNESRPGPSRLMSVAPTYAAPKSEIYDWIVKFFHELLIKYWIWVVATMLMIMSLSGSRVVIYRIVYMFLFLTFTTIFQLSLKWWRKLMYPFWLIVILYSMIILIAIYTYQFNNFPDYWWLYLRINKDLQEDLGLVVYDNDAFVLFKELLTPTFFIIITIIQVHFVHRDFLEFSSVDSIFAQNSPPASNNSGTSSHNMIMGAETDANASSSKASLEQSGDNVRVDIDLSQSDEVSSVQTVISKKPSSKSYSSPSNKADNMQISEYVATTTTAKEQTPKKSFIKEMTEVSVKAYRHMECLSRKLMLFLWRFLEIHILKLVLLCAVIIVMKDICAMNVFFVFLTVFLMVFSKFERSVCFFFGIWAGILILLKMLFQLNISQRIEWHNNCTVDNNGTQVIDNRIYIGFLKTDDIFNYISEYILLIVILVFRSVIVLRQRLYRRQEFGGRHLPDGIVFLDVNRASADKDFLNFVKFMINFSFYKFGVEMCLIFMTISIANRGDIFSVLYCIWLLMFILLDRRGNERLWSYFVGFLAILLPYQYLMCLGIPPGLCLSYPWSGHRGFEFPKAEREWYFLPDFKDPLPKKKLYLDFLVLFFACRQLIGFRLEKTLTCSGGSNQEAYKETNPQNVPDFFSFGTSIFDSIKSFFFLCFFWVTLAVLFLAGTTRINLFGLGYVLGSFIFLWTGNEFYLKPIKVIFKSWKSIIAYTCIAMLLKSIIQLFASTMLKHNLCWLIQLLGINYANQDSISTLSLESKENCITEDGGLLWDGICFTFLLIQKRIFCSHYFNHLIREIKAQHFLASRGAELIHEIQAKEVAEQELAEREVMEKIKQKMDRIKAAQQKMFADKARSIKYHKQAVKSGGYYMFEDFDSESVELSYGARESLIPDPEGNEIRNLAKSKGFTAFCSKIFKGEEEPSEATLVSAETADLGESSKDSAIVSVERPKYHPDESRPTTMTVIASTSQATDMSEFSSLRSRSSTIPKAGKDDHEDDEADKLELIAPQLQSEMAAEPAETYMQKIGNWFGFVKRFFESILISATSSLNSLSRDYRFVAKRLSVEKKCLKKVIEIEESRGNTHDFISDPHWRKSALSKLARVTEDTLENLVKSKPKNAIEQWSQLDNTPIDGGSNLYYVTLDAKYRETSIYIHFLRAIFYAILSRSEVMCYITIVINQIATASILSLPLPLFAFLWGSLSVPRPSKSFWVTCITFIEVIVVIKYVFQFPFWPWLETPRFSPFWWPRLIGIERKDNYANYDLFLLLVLFFHRFMLKSLGLWDLSETEMKAYMTNAELIQSETDRGAIGNENGKRHRSSKKSKNKNKSTKTAEAQAVASKVADAQAVPVEQSSDSSELISSQEYHLSGTEDDAVTRASREVDFDFLNDPEEVDDDDEDEISEFNAIFFMMSLPKRIKQRFKATVKPIIKFFHNVLHPPYRITHDVYSLMFLCDFINFFILVFGFYAFGSGYTGSADVARFLEENRIPIGFLITLLIQFAQIIVDRAIYLRKYIKGKLIFQIISVIFTHVWLFFILPAITDNAFTDRSNVPPKLWYVFKCIYFLLSAYQIRSGYPTRILGNTFCKKYNFINWYLFKMYMLIPFVYDLRMYMDWIWTDTSLVLDEWSLMEDIFVNLYQRKCELRLDEEFPEPRGKAKKRFFKYLIGGSWVLIIIALIWGPLGLFAFGRAVGETNPPMGATFELEISGFQPLFKMSVTGSGLVPIDDRKWSDLSRTFAKNPIAQTFINGYDQNDVYMVNLNGNSTATWGISPPSQRILVEELRQNETLQMKLTYYIMRAKQAKTQDLDTSIYDEHMIELDPLVDRVLRQQLADMIAQSDRADNLRAIIPRIFPNYLRAPEKGKPSVVHELLPRTGANDTQNYRNIVILMKRGEFSNDSSLTSWWEIHDDCADASYLDDFMRNVLLEQKCQYLSVVLFNDKVFIGLLAFLSGYGIIGIYTTFVFLVSRWVRGLNSESSFKVIYTRMPNVDRVLQLCLDIYLVRESREFELEEDLYAKLIFLYRSPETLIKWTKTNEEISVPNQSVFRTT